MQTMRSQRSGRVFEVLRRAQHVSPSLDMPPRVSSGAHIFAADHLQPPSWRRIGAFVGRQTASLHPSWRADSLRSPWARLEVGAHRFQASTGPLSAYSSPPERSWLRGIEICNCHGSPLFLRQPVQPGLASNCFNKFQQRLLHNRKKSGPAGSSASLRHKSIRLIR